MAALAERKKLRLLKGIDMLLNLHEITFIKNYQQKNV